MNNNLNSCDTNIIYKITSGFGKIKGCVLYYIKANTQEQAIQKFSSFVPALVIEKIELCSKEEMDDVIRNPYIKIYLIDK